MPVYISLDDVLDDMFHPDDLGSDPYTQLILIYIPCIIAAV